MKYLDLSLAQPEANLACDEALLDWSEETDSTPVLRLWESSSIFVVVGYSNPVARDVHVSVCEDRGIPVLRRCTGGGTIVQGPGCLNYALVLRIDDAETLRTIPGTNRYVMEKHRRVLESLLKTTVSVQGHTDLAVGQRKFSGNAQRRRRNYLLFHGSFLLQFDLGLIEALLPNPSVQPEYRKHRSHEEFLMNAPISRAALTEALAEAWDAREPFPFWPANATERLAREKYATAAWNRKV